MLDATGDASQLNNVQIQDQQRKVKQLVPPSNEIVKQDNDPNRQQKDDPQPF
jgi:hypothetical protein